MNTLRVEVSHSDDFKSLVLYSPEYVTVRCPRKGGMLELDIDTDAFLDMVVKLPVVQAAINED